MRILPAVCMLMLAWASCRPEVTDSASHIRSACSASPIEAAQALIASSEGALLRAGYRVQDLLIDPVLGKAWLRIASCNDSRGALLLLPLKVQLAGRGASMVTRNNTEKPAMALLAPPVVSHPAASDLPKTKSAVLIERNATVQVFVESSAVHMSLRGHALTSASAGELVEVTLDGKAEAGQERLRMQGIAVASDRVEVHP